MPRLLVLVSLLLLTSCVGYRWGGTKPTHLSEIHRIQVPLAKSQVIFPRAEVLLTNSLVDGLTQDGTYRIGKSEKSDAILYLTLENLRYRQIRSSRDDILRSEELSLEAQVHYRLVSLIETGKILEEGDATGRTRLFVDQNLQTARANALPDALERVALKIVSQLSDGI